MAEVAQTVLRWWPQVLSAASNDALGNGELRDSYGLGRDWGLTVGFRAAGRNNTTCCNVLAISLSVSDCSHLPERGGSQVLICPFV